MAALTLPKALFPGAMAFVSLFSGIPTDAVFAVSLIHTAFLRFSAEYVRQSIISFRITLLK